MPWALLPQSIRVRYAHHLGRPPPNHRQTCPGRIAPSPGQPAPLRRLATQARLHQQTPRQTSPLLWMWSDQPWSSNMPSSSESLKPSRRTSPTLGSDSYHKQAASPNTATSQTASASVSPSTSPASYPLRPPRTAPPSLNTAVNSLKSSRTSSPKAATLAHSPGTTSKLSLVPFNPPHSLSFQNRPKLTSSAFYKIILSHTKYLPLSLTLPLILSSIQMTSDYLGYFLCYLSTVTPTSSRLPNRHQGRV